MTLDLFIALISFGFITAFTPGPNNTMLLAQGVNFGFRRSLPLIFGVGIGFPLMIACLGFGLGKVFEIYPIIYTALKYIGAAYMIWLAWKVAMSGPVSAQANAAGKPMTFLQAALFQWVNPKGWAMALTGAAVYTVPAHYLLTLTIVAAVFGVICLPVVMCWASFGAGMRGFLQDPARVRVFNIAMAVLLLASLYPVLAGWE